MSIYLIINDILTKNQVPAEELEGDKLANQIAPHVSGRPTDEEVLAAYHEITNRENVILVLREVFMVPKEELEGGKIVSEILKDIPVKPTSQEIYAAYRKITSPDVAVAVPEAPPPPPPPPVSASAKPDPKILAKPAPRNIILPNGKQNESYFYTVEWSKYDINTDKFSEYFFEGLEAIGLQFVPASSLISGIPNQPGDYNITFKYKPDDGATDRPLLSRPVQLYVNPDPRSLWTESEPPAEAPYQKAHTEHLRHAEGPKTFIAASKRGRSHAKDGRFRDDDFAFNYDLESGWYTIAVCDGAGSAPFSRQGSRIASDTCIQLLRTEAEYKDALGVIDFLAPKFHKGTEDKDKTAENLQKASYKALVEVAFQAYKAIEQEAEKDHIKAKDYATTLLLAICKKFDFGWFVGTFWVGDGGIGIYTTGADQPIIMGEPDSGEYSGQTRFLTMPEIFADTEPWKRLKIKFLPNDFTALVLMSDGLTDAWFHTDSNLNRQNIWDDFFQAIQKEVVLSRDNADADKQLLSWLDFWVKGEYDDRTLAILF